MELLEQNTFKGTVKPQAHRLLQRALKDSRFGLTGIDKEKAKEVTLTDIESAQTVKERQMAVRTLVLMDRSDLDRDRAAQADQHHVERLAASAVNSSLDDPEVRAAMAAARMKRLAGPEALQ